MLRGLLAAFFRHAVEAADVASVRDTNPEIVVQTSEAINKWCLHEILSLEREHALDRQPGAFHD